VLADAGVVDAGGRGLCVLLDAAETAVTGHRPVGVQPTLGARAIPVPLPTGDLTADGPAYEVMFLLEADDDRIPRLRRTLGPLGDSLVVVGGDRLWNVHVHVDDVGAAIEAGIEAGRPYRVRVTHFAEQVARRSAAAAEVRPGRKVVVVAVGEGLSDLFAEAGAAVVPATIGRRPSTGQILEAIKATGAAEVVVLPNDRDSVAAAVAAARAAQEERPVRVAVVPTHAQVQGLAALAVHEPGRAFDQDVLEMTAAARHARSGAVTVAAKRAMTMGGPCEPGDVLGAIEGDFVVVGDDLFTVATEVLERLLGGGGELVTMVSGAEAGDLAERCAAHLAAAHPTVDVVVYDGGQQRYPLLLGVE
jgi:dihydroxyacetone kinase-like predicted kinase